MPKHCRTEYVQRKPHLILHPSDSSTREGNLLRLCASLDYVRHAPWAEVERKFEQVCKDKHPSLAAELAVQQI